MADEPFLLRSICWVTFVPYDGGYFTLLVGTGSSARLPHSQCQGVAFLKRNADRGCHLGTSLWRCLPLPTDRAQPCTQRGDGESHCPSFTPSPQRSSPGSCVCLSLSSAGFGSHAPAPGRVRDRLLLRRRCCEAEPPVSGVL